MRSDKVLKAKKGSVNGNTEEKRGEYYTESEMNEAGKQMVETYGKLDKDYACHEATGIYANIFLLAIKHHADLGKIMATRLYPIIDYFQKITDYNEKFIDVEFFDILTVEFSDAYLMMLFKIAESLEESVTKLFLLPDKNKKEIIRLFISETKSNWKVCRGKTNRNHKTEDGYYGRSPSSLLYRPEGSDDKIFIHDYMENGRNISCFNDRSNYIDSYSIEWNIEKQSVVLSVHVNSAWSMSYKSYGGVLYSERGGDLFNFYFKRLRLKGPQDEKFAGWYIPDSPKSTR